jgi:hypothetical protein
VTSLFERAVVLHVGCEGLQDAERLQIALHREALGARLATSLACAVAAVVSPVRS